MKMEAVDKICISLAITLLSIILVAVICLILYGIFYNIGFWLMAPVILFFVSWAYVYTIVEKQCAL